MIEFSIIEKQYIIKAIMYYTKELSKKPSLEGTFDLLELIDDLNRENIPKVTQDKQISCKKGCSYCCHIQVSMSEREGDVIMDYMSKKNMEFSDEEKERIEEQSKFTEEQALEYMLSPHRKCVFLKDNLCSIYTVRPFSCRNYYVFSEPELCNTDNTEDRKLAQYFNIHTLPIAFSLLETSSPTTMSRYLKSKL